MNKMNELVEKIQLECGLSEKQAQRRLDEVLETYSFVLGKLREYVKKGMSIERIAEEMSGYNDSWEYGEDLYYFFVDYEDCTFTIEKIDEGYEVSTPITFYVKDVKGTNGYKSYGLEVGTFAVPC